MFHVCATLLYFTCVAFCVCLSEFSILYIRWCVFLWVKQRCVTLLFVRMMLKRKYIGGRNSVGGECWIIDQYNGNGTVNCMEKLVRDIQHTYAHLPKIYYIPMRCKIQCTSCNLNVSFVLRDAFVLSFDSQCFFPHQFKAFTIWSIQMRFSFEI